MDGTENGLRVVHVLNDDRLFPGRSDTQIGPIPDETEPEWAVETILLHAHAGTDAIFEIKWKSGDVTWMPWHGVSQLPSIAGYLEALGIDNIDKLPMGKGVPPANDLQARGE